MESIFECLILQNLARNDSLYCLLSQANLAAITLGCTAILPVVYMTSLIQYCTQNIWLCYAFWTAIYAAIYTIPLLAILLNFIYSFKSSRLTERQGRILKLVGGIFMLFFGVIMIFKPEFLMFG